MPAPGAAAQRHATGRSTFPETLKRRAEDALADPRFDFIATYHAVADLRSLAKRAPGVLDDRTLGALSRLLRSDAFANVRQAYFLFREAASVMTDMAVAAGRHGQGSRVLACLAGLLRKTRGSAHRGIAEALGSLPVGVAGPEPANVHVSSPPAIAWTTLLAAGRLRPTGRPRYIGRSLVVRTAPRNRLLVVKLAKRDDDASGLAREIAWMTRLKQPAWVLDRRFHIPDPLVFGKRPLFRVRDLPLPPPTDHDRHPEGLAIAYVAHPDYFVYPNQRGVPGETALEVLGRNAYLMGCLTGRGVIHDAVIPLFHNRTQRLRRDDQGRYQWYRAGRLDRWLDSCAYPNLGLSGLRDFEHLAAVSCRGRRLYRHIGTHLLSLLLVAGSHFRSREGGSGGLDADGRPMDTRDL
ncbi:MAG TPA: SidJ-related pseudokinase, partial [Desulfosarcina sp.]|nr:SidJ-related pseudokinase [Desulfosarcina sp.]